MPEEAPIELQELVIAFQKSLARAAQTTAQVIHETPAMLHGIRQVYVVQRLEVELKVGAEVRRVELDGRPTEQVLVNFAPSADTAASLRFAVEATLPPEGLEEPSLVLQVSRAGRPLPPDRRVRAGEELEALALLTFAGGAPIAAVPVWLELSRLTEGAARQAPGAPDGERWVDVVEGRRWTHPRTTDAAGTASFRLSLPAPPSSGGDLELLRLRARARVPLLPGSGRLSVLAEKEPLLLTLLPGPAATTPDWNSVLLETAPELQPG